MHMLRSASDPLVDSNVLPFRCSEANKFHGLNNSDGSFASSYVLANQTSPFSPSPTLNLIHERDLRRTDTTISTSSSSRADNRLQQRAHFF